MKNCLCLRCEDYQSTANKQQFFETRYKGVVSLYSISSAFGGLRKPEGATLLFALGLIFYKMRRPVKNCSPGNNSTCSATLTANEIAEIRDYHKQFIHVVEFSSIQELIEKFKIEKHAKNQAYYFILENNLLDKFKSHCNEEGR